MKNDLWLNSLQNDLQHGQQQQITLAKQFHIDVSVLLMHLHPSLHKPQMQHIFIWTCKF